jgi:hypothetical protein
MKIQMVSAASVTQVISKLLKIPLNALFVILNVFLVKNQPHSVWFVPMKHSRVQSVGVITSVRVVQIMDLQIVLFVEEIE